MAADVGARREDLVRRAVHLGLADDLVDRVLVAGDQDVLTVLEHLILRAEAASADGPAMADALSVEAYRAALERIGADYVGTLSWSRLSALNTSPEQLMQDAEMMTETARLIRSVPVMRREALWPIVAGELSNAAASYGRISTVLVNTGIEEALEAEHRLALRYMRAELLPSADRELLRAAGELDPDAALAALVRSAHRAGEVAGRQKTMSQLLEEGRRALSQPGTPKRNWWTGFGKLLTGAGVVGVDVAGGVGLGAAAGPLAPLAVGVTWSAVLASCAGGVGAIVEAVGALRGE